MGRPYDIVILAGGTARRLGGATKPMLVVGGRRLLDHVLDGCAGAASVVVVGPPAPTERNVMWCREDPAGSGPLAGLATGMSHGSAPVVLVLAADMPFVAVAVPLLAAALLDDDDVAVLVDEQGIRQPLAGAYRRTALSRRIEELSPVEGLPVRLLLDGLRVRELRAGREAFDCDTWDDVQQAETQLTRPGASRDGFQP